MRIQTILRHMSRLLLVALLLMLAPPPGESFGDAHRNDMRAVWITTIFNLDYPSVKNNAQAQKSEYIQMLDQLQAMGINTVMVQIRPKGDALYPSTINPWSESLTGTQGKDPGYDPLAFMIEETHRRGMSFHAWLNPYRVTTDSTDVSALAANHPARLHPDWLITHKGALYYNPESAGVRQHILDTVAEIVTRYDVDGIHFDDYFYPSNYPLPSGEARDGAVANHRRETVNQMVAQVHQAIKSIDPSVLFGISPMGIWKNQKSDASGSATSGGEAYYAVFSDCRQWIQAGTVDYIAPQIYWEIGFAAADYETLVKWWSKEVQGTAVTLYIGQAAYRDAVAAQMDRQLALNRSAGNVRGSIFFRAKDLLNNRQGIADQLSAFYSSGAAGGTDSTGSTGGTSPSGSPVQALPSTHRVVLDGRPLPLQAYNIGGYNYFKLRDLAMALSGTSAQFDTLWDASSETIDLRTATPYIPVGGELDANAPQTAPATAAQAALTLNGAPVRAEAFNVRGNNYYKLRDLGSLIGFDVAWDAQQELITIAPK